ncbi:hypothetical protein [Chitinophaga cymbidii]|uniref:Uncharacterized protein n=1 Tax=Chitinophaga cymbidii TaxID=1096750 RepID=A0A512RFJ5_9BACT|nr:hypothetical protein [Chitinophaga cymbidii]GEP94486.1 hypothetical protein CCY01nite_07460 [Chitinophaga cymbidii]
MKFRTYNLYEVYASKERKYFPLPAKPYGIMTSYTNQFSKLGLQEARIYLEQLIRKYGTLPPSVELIIVKRELTFVTDIQTGMLFPEDKDIIYKYLDKLERGMKNWDEQSILELKKIKHPYYI